MLELKTRVYLQRATVAENTDGEQEETFSNVFECWAKVDEKGVQKAKEMFSQNWPNSDAVVKLPYSSETSGIGVGDRVVIKSSSAVWEVNTPPVNLPFENPRYVLVGVASSPSRGTTLG